MTNMNLEDQVCSLELAKRLKELGVKQESLFYWDIVETISGLTANALSFLPVSHQSTKYYSAFTVAELGNTILKNFNEFAQGWQDSESQWLFTYGDRGTGYMIEGCGKFFFSDEPLEVNARAELIIYLLENGLIKNE